jgi:hypothetical protein
MKKTVYHIRTAGSEEFHRIFPLLIEKNFVYREQRLTTAAEVINNYGYPRAMVMYAHPTYPRVILSESGDELDMNDYNTIKITVEEFLKQKLYITPKA